MNKPLDLETIEKIFRCYDVFDVTPINLGDRKVCKIDVKLSDVKTYEKLTELDENEELSWQFLCEVEDTPFDSFTLESIKIVCALIEKETGIAFPFQIEARYVNFLNNLILVLYGDNWQKYGEFYIHVNKDFIDRLKLAIREKGYDIVFSYLLKVGNPCSREYQIGIYETFVKNRYS